VPKSFFVLAGIYLVLCAFRAWAMPITSHFWVHAVIISIQSSSRHFVLTSGGAGKGFKKIMPSFPFVFADIIFGFVKIQS